jgi:hypothetical protein
MTTPRRTRAEWVQIIATQKASGLTQGQWCLQNGINANTFRAMRRKIAVDAADTMPPITTDVAELSTEWIRLDPKDTGIPIPMKTKAQKPREGIEIRIGALLLTVVVIP